MYIDIEEDLTLESVILSSEYNGPHHQQSSQSVIYSDDDDVSLGNSLTRDADYDSNAEDSFYEEDESLVLDGTHTSRHSLSHSNFNTASNSRSRPTPQSPSDIDLRASFSTLLNGNYERHTPQRQKKGVNTVGSSLEHKSSAVRLDNVRLVPDSEMDQLRGINVSSVGAGTRPRAADAPAGGLSGGSTKPKSRRDQASTSGPNSIKGVDGKKTAEYQSVLSQSPRSSRSPSTTTSNPGSPPHRRRRKSSKPNYDSSNSGPFGQVDLSTVSLAAAGISLVAGLSFSAGYAFGRRSDVHLTVVS